ncbi:hypothetical protein GCM10009682_37250 [Luedemannella flava]|uniref:Uncharacterized protein n=1 Tax=Luedemannella flava TaxID=349316 RepID=A0ABN2MA36_9ACTN
MAEFVRSNVANCEHLARAYHHDLARSAHLAAEAVCGPPLGRMWRRVGTAAAAQAPST